MDLPIRYGRDIKRAHDLVVFILSATAHCL